ncbi:MAG: dUTP diphosphatase [Candidatus Dadabacteria bacterium]|nr:MAG: dUTP diphosphatase [Candidatus Dadabacteria bacterium]
MADATLHCRRLRDSARLPTKGHSDDLGWDLYAESSTTVAPGTVARISTGIAVAFPDGIGALIKDRSSMAARGLHCLAGVIDPGYRGEILVVVANLGPDAIDIAAGDRFAQMLLFPVVRAQIRETRDLDDTARGSGGFGSTGA